MQYSNKIVLITGASSGIGKALAIEFNQKGAVVIACARNMVELEKLKIQCTFPDKCDIRFLDLEQNKNFDDFIKKIIFDYKRLDILINNGGLSQRANACNTPIDIDRKLMEVNYFGNIALTKAVLPIFKNQKSGHIIVISSIAGKFGFYLRSAYSASKHALHGFYESLRLEEEANGIKILLVCPGKVATNISVNAIKGDGTSHGIMDKQQLDGVSVDFCVHEIIKAIENNKEEVFIGGKEIKAVKLKRFFPKLFGKIIRKQKRE